MQRHEITAKSSVCTCACQFNHLSVLVAVLKSIRLFGVWLLFLLCPPTVTVLPSAKKVATDVSMEYRGTWMETKTMTQPDWKIEKPVWLAFLVSAENCLKKPDPGPCRAAFKSFFYSPDAGTCQEFFYGGCRGNKNRYESWAECMDSCGKESYAAVAIAPSLRQTKT